MKENPMTTRQEAVVRLSPLTNVTTSIFAVLGLIDIALLGVVGSHDAPPLMVSIGVAALGLITLVALVPARRGSRGALGLVVVARVISAALAAPAFFLHAPVWVMIVEAFVIAATVVALVLLRRQLKR
jgi:membrane protein YdbS with pleckstrin-like domain